ncbi:MAG: aldo/keto reductase [Chloroflexi bacterium]|nr:aldo/keto reductase [Chloroflexota bacterium]
MDRSSPPPALAPRPLGRTGLLVSPVSLGCAPLGNIPTAFPYEVPEERALDVIRATFQSPIAFLDTGASYGDGESERRIGIVLRELGGVPDGYVLATKVDRDLHTGDFSGAQIERSLERSLRLLGLDRLALVYLHDPEHTTFEAAMAPGGPMDVLRRFQQQGVVEHLGVAGGPIDMLTRYVETGAFEVAITHNRFTLLKREAEPLLDVCQARGVAVVNAAPYGGGMLAKGPSSYPRYRYRPAPSALLERAEQIAALCDEAGVPLAAAALQFSMRDPRIASTIVGMTRVERIAETVALATHPIPDALWTALEPLALPDDPA